MKKGKKIFKNAWVYLVIIIVVYIINIPFMSMVGTSLKTKAAAMSTTSLLPKVWTLENYVYVFKGTTFAVNLLNSFYVSILVTLSCIFIAAMAGYALSRFRGKFFSGYSVFMLLLQMFPGVLLLIPLFIIYNQLNIINTPMSVILSYLAINLPFSIWMLKGFFDTISFSLEESAMIDGCSQFRTFWKIVMPISAPGLCSVAIFTFITSWNEYMLASIFLRSDSVQTLTVGLQKFVQQYTSDWAALMAASTISTIPTIIFLLVAQKYLIEGLTAGAVKG